MNRHFTFWASVMIVSLIGTGLCMRFLAMSGISAGESLVTRGVGCLLVVVFFSYKHGLSLKIKAPSTQMRRALIAGLALTCYTLCYSSLSASAVSTLSNIDVPLLLVLGPIVGVKAAKRVQVAAVVAIFFLVWFVYGIEKNPEVWRGLALLLVGTVLLCFGYWFIKQSMTEENEAVTILVPALAILAYGLAQWLMDGSKLSHWNLSQAFAASGSGICMFLAYHSTMKLYQVTDIATAEFPTLISSLLIQPIEMLILDAQPHFIYVASTLGFVVTTYVILRWQHSRSDPVHA